MHLESFCAFQGCFAIATINAGWCFGGDELVNNKCRDCSCVAKTNIKLLRVEKRQFLQLYEVNIVQLQKITVWLSLIMRNRKNPIFSITLLVSKLYSFFVSLKNSKLRFPGQNDAFLVLSFLISKKILSRWTFHAGFSVVHSRLALKNVGPKKIWSFVFCKNRNYRTKIHSSKRIFKLFLALFILESVVSKIFVSNIKPPK